MGRQDPQFTNNDLYGSSGRPQASDIEQDDLYNCYLLAPMGALADRQPERIRDMVSYGPSQTNPDANVFAVMLYRLDGIHERIEVSSAEVQDNIRRDGGSRADNSGGAPIWPAVIETAFAKLHDPDRSNGSLNDAYEYIGKRNGGGALDDGMYALTGDAGRRLRITGGVVSTEQGSSTRSDPDEKPTFSARSNRREDMTEQQAYTEVQAALNNGHPVTLSTRLPKNQSQEASMANDGLFEGHGYAVTGIERRDDGHAWVTLRNPYAHNNDPGGSERGNTRDALISVPLDRIVASGGIGEFNIGPAPRTQTQGQAQDAPAAPAAPPPSAAEPAPAVSHADDGQGSHQARQDNSAARPGSTNDARTASPLAIERLSPRDRDNYDQGLALAQRLGLPPDKAQNFSLAMAAEIKENGQILRTDKLVAVQGRGEDGGDRIFASYHPHGDKEPIFNTSLDVNRAANVPMEQSFNRIEQTQQQQIAQTQSQNIDDPSRGPKMG